MAKALYHQEFREPQSLVILAEHADGTVDLGHEDGRLVIGHCPVSDASKPGHATRCAIAVSDDEASAILAAQAAGADPKPAKKPSTKK